MRDVRASWWRVGLFLTGVVSLVASVAMAQPQVGLRVDNLRLLKCTEEGGVKPQYDKYRLSSWRYMVRADWVEGPWSLGVLLGQADLKTHSSEGETTEFDPEMIWGLHVSAYWPMQGRAGFGWRLVAEYLQYSPDSEKVTATPKDAPATGGDLSVDWIEWKVAAELVKSWNRVELSLGPVWQDVSIDQDRVYADRTVSSSFNPEDDLGLRTRLRWYATPQMEADLVVEFVHRSIISLGLSYRF